MLRANVAIVLVLTTALAHAQSGSPESTRLWEEGRALMDKRQYKEACDKFRASIAITPAFSTQLNLGVCLDKLGQHAEAWRIFDAAAESEKSNPDRYKYARDLADGVLPKLGTVVLRIAAPDAPGLSLTVAGRQVSPASTVKELVEPGDIEVTRTQAGGAPYARTVHVDAGGEVEITVPVPSEQDGGGSDRDPQVGRRRSRVILAYGVGGAGVVALAAGILVGVKARSDYNAQFDNMHCTDGPTSMCDDVGLQAQNDARSLANVGTVLGISGAALVGAGVVLWLTAPRDVVVTPTATAQAAGISVVGRF